MRRAADLYPGEAKTDRRDACVLAGTGRARRKQARWLDAGSVRAAVAAALAAQDVTVPAEAATGRVISELAAELDRVCARRGSLAAFASLRDPASRAFYDRKRAEGKRHNAALICLARRRCDVILAMLRTGRHYQAARPAPGLAEAA